MADHSEIETPDLMEQAAELFTYLDQFMYRFVVTQSNSLDTPWGMLSHQEDKVIRVLGLQGPCIMREIADPLGLALSTATGVVDRLVKKNLVHRERSNEDRRIVKVILTKEGKEICEKKNAGFMKLCRNMLKCLTPEEQNLYLSLTQKISQSE